MQINKVNWQWFSLPYDEGSLNRSLGEDHQNIANLQISSIRNMYVLWQCSGSLSHYRQIYDRAFSIMECMYILCISPIFLEPEMIISPQLINQFQWRLTRWLEIRWIFSDTFTSQMNEMKKIGNIFRNWESIDIFPFTTSINYPNTGSLKIT